MPGTRLAGTSTQQIYMGAPTAVLLKSESAKCCAADRCPSSILRPHSEKRAFVLITFGARLFGDHGHMSKSGDKRFVIGQALDRGRRVDNLARDLHNLTYNKAQPVEEEL